MRKAYLLIYSDDAGSRESIKNWADKDPMVKTWRYDLPNCFYIISEHSAQQLHDSFQKITRGNGRYMFAEVTANKQGWMFPDTWYLLNNKKHKPANTK